MFFSPPRPPAVRRLGRLFFRAAAAGVFAASAAGGPPARAGAGEPDNSGPVKLATASWLGGSGDDQLVGAEITADGGVLLAGNALDLPALGVPGGPAAPAPAPAADDAGGKGKKPKADKNAPSPGSSGFVLLLGADGQKVRSAFSFAPGTLVKKVQLGPDGSVYVLGSAAGDAQVGAARGSGAFVAVLSADAKQVKSAAFHEADDFAVDADGGVVVLAGKKLARLTADGRGEKWSTSWATHGDNRPGAMVVSPQTGVAAVVGYGMTRTNKEPYKDPFAYGFDRDGKPLWALWNPDPKSVGSDTKLQLEADTTGHMAGAAGDGRIYLGLYADGGNTVCARDPSDAGRKLDAEVMKGVHQNGPGYGFKGASKTSVIFRLDAATGKLEKGTWMSAWIDKAHANSLNIHAAAGDDRGNTYVVGDSATGCPTQSPWYVAPEGGYKGGGFMAVLDKDFKMTQCGYFPGTGLRAVACRKGAVVIVGNAAKENHAGDKAKGGAEITYPVPAYHPLQKEYGGGQKDGWFAVFHAG